MSLRLDWCSHEAAKYAVENWHYSKTMPLGTMIRLGVWEFDRFIGCILFARGNTPTLGNRYGLTQLEVCELVRVALRNHAAPVSKILSVAITLLRQRCPGLKLIVSFADPAHGHIGCIYQAGNWIYCGQSNPEFQFLHQGKWKHRREVTSGAFGGTRKVIDGGKSLPKRLTSGKYRYLMPLDEDVRKRIAPLARPYPKRVGSDTIDTAAVHAEKGGETPTPTLQSMKAVG